MLLQQFTPLSQSDKYNILVMHFLWKCIWTFEVHPDWGWVTPCITENEIHPSNCRKNQQTLQVSECDYQGNTKMFAVSKVSEIGWLGIYVYEILMARIIFDFFISLKFAFDTAFVKIKSLRNISGFTVCSYIYQACSCFQLNHLLQWVRSYDHHFAWRLWEKTLTQWHNIQLQKCRNHEVYSVTFYSLKNMENKKQGL
jgi:hypothetical protein